MESERKIMASRELLHISKLNDFGKWLEEQGYMILPTSKNQYEVLRAKKDKDTVIIYCKAGSKEHLSIMDKDCSLIRRFINESRKQTNADRIRSMTDEELAAFCCKVKADYQWVDHEYPDEDACEDWEEWLQAESEG